MQAQFRAPFIVITAIIAYLFGLGPALFSIFLSLVAYSIANFYPDLGIGRPSSRVDDIIGYVVLVLGMLILTLAALHIRNLNGRLRQNNVELQNSEGSLRSILNIVTVGIILANAEGRVEYASPGVERILGGPAVGVNPDHPPRPYQIMRDDGTPIPDDDLPITHAIRSGRSTFGVRLYVIRYDGTGVHVLLDCVAMKDEHGIVTGAVLSLTDSTKQVQAEELLRKQEQDYRTLSENAPEAIARFDLDLRHTYINDYGAKVYGVPRDQIIGKSNSELGIPSGRLEAWEDRLKEVISTGKQNTVDFEFDSPVFGHQFYSSIIVPEFDENGKVKSVLGIARDVTALRNTERDLEKERARLQAVLESLPVAVWIADEKGAIVQVNDMVNQVWGKAPSPGKLTEYSEYKGWWSDTGKLLPPEEWALARAIHKGEHSQGEIIDIERFDGGHSTILNSASPVKDSEGRTIGAVAAAQDITSMLAAERELRRSYDLLNAIIDNTPAAIYVKDISGKIIVANKGLADLTSYSKEEIIGKTSFDLYPAETAQGHTVNDLEVIRLGKPISCEEAIPGPDGFRTFLSIKFPLKDVSGKMYGIGGVSSEITERVKANQELERMLGESRRERERVAAMESVAEAGVCMQAIPDLLPSLAERIRDGLKADSCLLLTCDPREEEFEVVAACEMPGIVGTRLKKDEGLLDRLVSEPRTVYVEDVETDPSLHDISIGNAKIKSLLATPLIVSGNLIGAVFVGMKDVVEFQPEDLSLFELMATRSALIISNARLREDLKESLDMETHFSHMLQQALLPTIDPVMDGLSVASVYIPAFISREIGGDFYDLFQTADGKYALLIGDVSGKGLEAAAFAAESRNTIHAFTYEFSSPGEALTRANPVLSASQEAFGLFTTVFLAVIDTKNGELRYSGAGHPPLAIFHRDGEVEFMDIGNPPLGLMPFFDYKESKSRIEYGEKAVLYTDGITEARVGSDLFGLDGVKKIIEEYGKLSPSELLDHLVQGASDWAGGHLRDDTAVLLVERVEKAEIN